MTSLDMLYPLITGAIMDAERLQAKGDPAAGRAHLEVSRLEEQAAELLPASDLEGGLARSSAVSAAIDGGDPSRALSLAARYLAEPDVSQILREDLTEILTNAGLAIPVGDARVSVSPR